MSDSPADDETELEDEQWWQDVPKFRDLLREEMKLLRTSCGWPSRTQIAQEIEALGDSITTSSISNVMAMNDNMSSWTNVRRVVEVLGGDLRYFYPLYLRASGLIGARRELERFERILAEGLPTRADPAHPFTMPGQVDQRAMSLQFVDAPPPLGEKPRLPHELWALQLRSQPGRWALIPALSTAQYVTTINKGTIQHYRPAGAFEAIWRMGSLYVRYVGARREYA